MVTAVTVAVGVVAPLAPAKSVRRVGQHQIGGLVEAGEQVNSGLEAQLEFERRPAGHDKHQPGRALIGALDDPYGVAEPPGPAAAAQRLKVTAHAAPPAHVARVAGDRVQPAVTRHIATLFASCVNLREGVRAVAQRLQDVCFGGELRRPGGGRPVVVTGEWSLRGGGTRMCRPAS